ncbi:YopX family protein [Lactiplantibacillus plantarum]|nr:YopX family protein [Lactiplantibacillus plantarum]WHQ66327.1 YopX family protein [Lactiplantibacillus plantarum]
MIKFRAWDKVQNKMLLPDNKEFIHGQAYWAEASTDGQDECSNDGKVDGIGALFELEQFTGLTDVNGKDIYEGDIVRILSINVISDIKYMRDGVTPEFEIDRQKVFDEDNVLGTATCESDVEIIGNVHANPELLEGHK